MAWSQLNFGEYKGKTLPQVIFLDPDWFLGAYEKNKFKGRGRLESEANEIHKKATHIKIPQLNDEEKVAEYLIDPSVNKFNELRIIPKSRHEHIGSTGTIRKDVIDLSVPRKIRRYDKRGGRLLISNVKDYIFGSESYRMTKKRCEEFFDNKDNFTSSPD